MGTVKADNFQSSTGGNPDIEYDDKDLVAEYKLRESLLNSFALSGLTFRDDWVTLTAYAVDDVVITTAKAYRCIDAHTSGVFATDLAAAKWEELTSSAGTIIVDAGSRFTATTLEGVLAEIFDRTRFFLNGHLAVSGTDTYAATPSPALTAYNTGEVYSIYFANANTIAAPTLNLNALGAKTLVDTDGSALVAGNIDGQHLVKYNGTSMVVLNSIPVASTALAIDSHDHAYDQISATWTLSTAYVVGDKVRAVSPDGVLYFECTSAGTTDTTEPTWPTTHGATVVDNTVTWTTRDGQGDSLVEESFPTPTAGSSYRVAINLAEFSITTGTSFETTDVSILVPRTGSYQVVFEMKEVGGGMSHAQIWKDASPSYAGAAAVGTDQTDNTSAYVEKTETLSLNAGDVLTLYVYHSISQQTDIKNFRLESAVKLFG